jgi:hypothetical protein
MQAVRVCGAALCRDFLTKYDEYDERTNTEDAWSIFATATVDRPNYNSSGDEHYPRRAGWVWRDKGAAHAMKPCSCFGTSVTSVLLLALLVVVLIGCIPEVGSVAPEYWYCTNHDCITRVSSTASAQVRHLNSDRSHLLTCLEAERGSEADHSQRSA